MANMAYCRWRNTLADLQDCYDNLHGDDVSEEEYKAYLALIELCKKIVEEVS